MIIDFDGPARFSIFIFCKKFLGCFRQFFGIGVIHTDNNRLQKRLDPLNITHLNFAFQFLFKIIRRHNSDDVSLPDIRQTVGPQQSGKCFIPGDPFKINTDFPFQLVFHQQVLVHRFGHCPQHRLEIRLAHGQMNGRCGKFLCLVTGAHHWTCRIFFCNEGRRVNLFGVRRRGMTLRIFSKRRPLLEKSVLFFIFDSAGTAPYKHECCATKNQSHDFFIHYRVSQGDNLQLTNFIPAAGFPDYFRFVYQILQLWKA